MRIYLTGFMGSGKTTVGRLLAQSLNCSFADLDYEIERHEKRTIAEIFQAEGESYFREVERKTLHSISLDPVVIASGGGCFIYNREWMLEHGTVIYLQVPFAELVSRLSGDSTRPLWRNAEKLFAQRESIYRTAHHTVDATGTPEEITLRTLRLCGW